jgi:hypothetical protein
MRLGNPIFSGPVAFTPEPFMLTMETDEAPDAGSGACSEGPLAGSYFGPPRGIINNGRYRRNVILVRFDVPPGWRLRGTQPSNDGGEIAVLLDSSFPGTYAALDEEGQNSP